MERSGEYETRHEVVRLLTQLVELRNDCYIALKNAEKEKQKGLYDSMGKVPAESQFNDYLDVLLLNYYHKFKKGSVDIPEDIEKQLDDDIPTVEDLTNMKERKILFHRINRLMEDLGHTAFEIEKKKDTGFGKGGDEEDDN